MIHTCVAQVGVNFSGSAPDQSSGLDVDFSDKGFLPPRLTTAQRDAILSPALGLMIFNTDCNTLNLYYGSGWSSVITDNMNTPSAAGVISGSSSVCPGTSGVNFSISPVNGASDYVW